MGARRTNLCTSWRGFRGSRRAFLFAPSPVSYRKSNWRCLCTWARRRRYYHLIPNHLFSTLHCRRHWCRSSPSSTGPKSFAGSLPIRVVTVAIRPVVQGDPGVPEILVHPAHRIQIKNTLYRTIDDYWKLLH